VQSVRMRQMHDLRHKIDKYILWPVFVSKKLEQLDLRPKEIINQRILRKWQGKFDCLVYEMLWIKECNQSLNTQTDSIHAKLFVWLKHCNSSIYCFYLLFIHFYQLSFWLDNDVSSTSKHHRLNFNKLS